MVNRSCTVVARSHARYTGIFFSRFLTHEQVSHGAELRSKAMVLDWWQCEGLKKEPECLNSSHRGHIMI